MLEKRDRIVATYREHGHALVRGVPMTTVMAEMYGKQEGCSRGRGGSMHLFDWATNFHGGNAIVGGGLPLAVGLALADRMQKRRAVTACILGDGAAAEGEFHESLNLAALWDLPVLFLCENNLYAMGTALLRHQAQPDLSAKAAVYGLTSHAVDGMDVVAVEEAAREAATAVREGLGPRFLELRTYRFRAHSMYDPELYRDKREVEEWKKRDPIALFSARLREAGLLQPRDVERLEGEIDREVADAVAYADAGTLEPAGDLLRDVTTPRRAADAHHVSRGRPAGPARGAPARSARVPDG